MESLPTVLIDRICLFLCNIRDASALQKTCKRLRWAGLGPECTWHWRLNLAQSVKLCCESPLRDRILQPGTAIHTIWIRSVDAHTWATVNNVHRVCMERHIETHGTLEVMDSILTLPDTLRVYVRYSNRVVRLLSNNRMFAEWVEYSNGKCVPVYEVPRRYIRESSVALRMHATM